MPLLDVICEQHGVSEVLVDHRSLGSPAALATELRCPTCLKPVRRNWMISRGRPGSTQPRPVLDFRDGWDMGAGKYFSTKRQRDNWISETGKRRVRD